MERVVERCAGLDVHKDTVVACVRVPDPVVDGGRRVEVASFGTTTVQLLALRDWLTELEVTRVGMESTGVYWKPPYHLLEDAFECWLLNAAHLKNVPGRKTDLLTELAARSVAGCSRCGGWFARFAARDQRGRGAAGPVAAGGAAAGRVGVDGGPVRAVPAG